MKLNDDKFPNRYDSWERGTTSARVQPKPKKRLNTGGAFCPQCNIVMVPSGGACFHCPSCGGTNTRCS